jgi:hypothetical protein
MDSSGGSWATEPGRMTLSIARLRVVRPDLFGAGRLLQAAKVFMEIVPPGGERKQLAEQLERADSRAAVVLETSPLTVAAYSADLDCVAILKVDDPLGATLVRDHQLSAGSKLITVNTYSDALREIAPDLVRGPLAVGPWTNFNPVIGDFLTDDRDRLEQRKKAIKGSEWERVRLLGEAYRAARPGVARDGRPGRAGRPATVPPGAAKPAPVPEPDPALDQRPGHVYLAKASDDVVSHCRCELALIESPAQMDCPWCGCGWLFTCASCGKAFTFAQGVWLEESWEQTANRVMSRLLRRPPQADEAAAWVAGMRELLENVIEAEQYVYLDGFVIPRQVSGLDVEGIHSRHDLRFLPHVRALTDRNVLKQTLSSEQYWRQNQLRA